MAVLRYKDKELGDNINIVNVEGPSCNLTSYGTGTITENGIYTVSASDLGFDGFSDLTVDVNVQQGGGCDIGSVSVPPLTENGFYSFNASDLNCDCFNYIEFNVNVGTPEISDAVLIGGVKFAYSKFNTIPDVYYDFIANSGNDLSNMFKGANITSFDCTKLPLNYEGTNLDYFFSQCHNLTSLDLSSWDLSNVVSIQLMFEGCSNLNEINVGSWNTSNIVSTYGAFSDTRITSLDLSSWNTSLVGYAATMFSSCGNLKTLNISGWDTSNMRSIEYMFAWCSNLEEINMSDFVTHPELYGYWGVFDGLDSLRKLKWDHLGETASWDYIDFSSSPIAVNTEDCQDAYEYSIGTFTNAFDRFSAGYGTCTLVLSAATKEALGDEIIFELTSKGYSVA